MTEIKIDKLFRSRRRTIGLEVTQDAKLVVRAPVRTPLDHIQKILRKKQDWIIRSLALSRKRRDEYVPVKFVEGENFYYLGSPYRLNLTDGEAIGLTDVLELPKAMARDARQHLIRWYKTAAYEKIKERVDRYSKTTGLPYAGVKISSAKKRLGSCSATGSLNFSWRLVMAPTEVVDYVVVHELAHLEEKNHARPFWNKVRGIMPDYKKSVSWLKENVSMLDALR